MKKRNMGGSGLGSCFVKMGLKGLSEEMKEKLCEWPGAVF